MSNYLSNSICKRSKAPLKEDKAEMIDMEA